MRRTEGSKSFSVFLLTTAILALLGLAVITNASIPLSQANFGESFYYFRHQIIYGFGLGILAFLFFYRFNYHRLKKFSLGAVLLAVLLLAAVFVPGLGYESGGAKRWLGVLGFSFQPSELAKLAIIIYLAYWLESKKDKIKNPLMLLPFLFWLGVIGGLVLIEPDLGTFLIISAISLGMYFSAGAKAKTILAVGLAGVLVLTVLIAAEPYRRERFLSFLDPQEDTAGRSYQSNQALITIGSGGVFGLGLGKGIQKYNYLPETIGDSVFAVISEELGLVGAGFVLFLYLIWVLAGLKLAAAAKHIYGRYLTLGVVIWIGLQAFINILGILGLVPFSGIPLPFISYGGSALLIELAAVGIVANVARGR
ncbi:MAG: putative lipid II flippase FtsW [Parcubacteria group bacterium]|nr:putative lipid II flippase FtsW [Parcubacteria group bacterium]